MNPIAKRTITALSAATVVVLAILFLPVSILASLLTLLIALVHFEFATMISRKYETMIWPGVCVGFAFLASITAAIWSYNFSRFAGVIGLLAFFIFALFALFSKRAKPIEALATTFLGFMYIPFMLSALLIVILSGGTLGVGMNPNIMLLYFLAIIKISDMAGFAFGVAFGKHKMCPTISPNKSWEGMGGSIFGSCLISCVFIPWTHFSFGKALVMGIVAAVVGTLGDLIESRIKREIGVKDSSQFAWTNGMGGFLDMFDSLIFAPLMLLIVLSCWK